MAQDAKNIPALGEGKGADALRVRRVLILHSFGRNFAPFTAVSSTFRAELARQSAAPIEFLEASLEATMFAEAGSETPLVEYLRALFAKRPADLIVPIGAPAMFFLQRHSDTLFPGVPVLVVAADKRRLNDLNRSGNATAFGISLDLAGIVDNILRILPRTTNVEVVTGNSPFERFWQTEFRRDSQRLNDRVHFDWLNELSFEEIDRRLSRLPPDSAIVYFLLVVDAAGVPYEQECALDVLRRNSNAPIFGIFDHQLGRGIVGGPLYPYQEVSRESARIALRILNGTPASSIKPVFLGSGIRIRLARAEALGHQRITTTPRQCHSISFIVHMGAIPLVHHRSTRHHCAPGSVDRWFAFATHAATSRGGRASGEPGIYGTFHQRR